MNLSKFVAHSPIQSNGYNKVMSIVKSLPIIGLLGSISYLLLSCLTQQPTVAQTLCQSDGEYELPSSTYRTVKLETIGISVDIPENYRAMKKQDGLVEILHPDDYEWIQCLVNGGEGGHGYYSESIHLVDDDLTMNLKEQAINLSGYSIDRNGNRRPIDSMVLTYRKNGISGYIVASSIGYSVSFLGTIPGQSKLLQVNASCDCHVEIEDLIQVLDKIKPLN